MSARSLTATSGVPTAMGTGHRSRTETSDAPAATGPDWSPQTGRAKPRHLRRTARATSSPSQSLCGRRSSRGSSRRRRSLCRSQRKRGRRAHPCQRAGLVFSAATGRRPAAAVPRRRRRAPSGQPASAGSESWIAPHPVGVCMAERGSALRKSGVRWCASRWAMGLAAVQGRARIPQTNPRSAHARTQCV